MRGKMAWFNEEKGHGYITTEAGERIYVSQDGFAEGNAPKGRCAGLPVEFELDVERRRAPGRAKRSRRRRPASASPAALPSRSLAPGSRLLAS